MKTSTIALFFGGAGLVALNIAACAKADDRRVPAASADAGSLRPTSLEAASVDAASADADFVLRALPMPQQYPPLHWDASRAK